MNFEFVYTNSIFLIWYTPLAGCCLYFLSGALAQKAASPVVILPEHLVHTDVEQAGAQFPYGRPTFLSSTFP